MTNRRSPAEEMIRPKGTLVPAGPVVVPVPVLLMFALGRSKFGWFSTLMASTRNSNSFVSVILTRLIKLASNPRAADSEWYCGRDCRFDQARDSQEEGVLGVGNRLIA